MAPVKTSVKYLRDGSSQEDAINRMTNASLSFHERKLAYRIRNEETIDRRTVTVNSMRGKEAEFSIKEQGFEIVPLRSRCTNFQDPAEVAKTYYPEVIALLQKHTGASYVHPYDHTVRYQTEVEALAAPVDDTTVDIHGPSRIVHIDDTPRNARRMIGEKLTEGEAARVKGKPFAIMNVWKPLKTVRRDPLALIDARTISIEDRLAQPLPAPDSYGGDWEVFMLKWNEKHKWWFQPDQKDDEAFVFKIYDSSAEDSFMGAAHVSIVDPETENLDARESIEVRSLVF